MRPSFTLTIAVGIALACAAVRILSMFLSIILYQSFSTQVITMKYLALVFAASITEFSSASASSTSVSASDFAALAMVVTAATA